VIALTEGPLLDGHDYGHRDYVESFFDVPVDYANARRTIFVELAHLVAVDARTVGAALAAMVANGRGTSDERMERSSYIYV
jgi:hypothetical protein